MPVPSVSAFIGALALMAGAFIVYAFQFRKYGRREGSLPRTANNPNPRKHPAIPQVVSIPPLKVLDQTTVVLSSGRAIKEVLDKNGLSTGDRFRPYTILPRTMGPVENTEQGDEGGRVLLDAGAKTSASFLHSFVMVMACYPDVQAKAQAEIDQVLRVDKLPVLEDNGNLPYLHSSKRYPNSISLVHTIFEKFACCSSIDSDLPLRPGYRVASRDTQYNGFVIPRGSIIFMNISFKPERCLLSEFGTKPRASTEGLRDSLPFGAGRRICPGAEIASRNIAMDTINLLWTFNFSQDMSGACTMDLENYLARICILLLAPSLLCRLEWSSR
ncbi:hypothetical protein PLEOSDRAFT_166009 [Pleurotus ostreatus PC15]|uniref:Cytochrome P450 n=1 Tax=Pleurotus ostreatus (strain PC15) TaxID=1137138 RepID=A0A067P3Q8_PLEO1|nr:hypothetical protein PLEOSDRAFT_166009 [Pleurotus ostreatus PC15]